MRRRAWAYWCPTATAARRDPEVWLPWRSQACCTRSKQKAWSSSTTIFPVLTRQGDLHVAGSFKGAWLKDPDGNILHVLSVQEKRRHRHLRVLGIAGSIRTWHKSAHQISPASTLALATERCFPLSESCLRQNVLIASDLRQTSETPPRRIRGARQRSQPARRGAIIAGASDGVRPLLNSASINCIR